MMSSVVQCWRKSVRKSVVSGIRIQCLGEGYGGLLLLCCAMLFATTVSAPEVGDESRAEYNPILPPTFLTLGRMVIRATVLVIIGYCLYLSSNQKRFAKIGALLLSWILFCAWGLLSVLWSALPWISFIQCLSFCTLIGLAWLIGVQWHDSRMTSRLLFGLSLLCGLTSLGLLVLYQIRPDVGALTKDSTGIFHSTSAGATASLGIFLVLSTWLVWGWTWSKWLALTIPVHAVSLLLGGNRFSFVALAISLATVVGLAAPRREIAWTTVVACLFFLGYLVCDPGLQLLDRALSKLAEFSSQGQTQQQLQDVSGRSDMWAAIWKSYLDSPVIGHGYFVTSSQGEIFMWDDWGNWTAHNLLLQALVSTGLIGLSLLLLAGLFSATSLIGQASSRSIARLRHLYFFAGLAGWYLTWGLINESILGVMQPESIIFAVGLGICTGLTYPAHDSTESFSSAMYESRTV